YMCKTGIVGQGSRHQKSMCGFYINVQDGHLRNEFYIKFISVPLPSTKSYD
ncbi:hypothetical protein SS7213T_11370, partial [Staphylococcus simiae CCM 7213 = CCUG 51256]